MLIPFLNLGLLQTKYGKIKQNYDYFEIPLLKEHREIIIDYFNEYFFFGIIFDDKLKKDLFNFVKEKIIYNFDNITYVNDPIKLLDIIVKNIYIDITEEELFYLKLKYPFF